MHADCYMGRIILFFIFHYYLDETLFPECRMRQGRKEKEIRFTMRFSNVDLYKFVRVVKSHTLVLFHSPCRSCLGAAE